MPIRSTPRLAILIDVENFPSRCASALFDQLRDIGSPLMRRGYGDFSNPTLKPWAEALACHAIEARHLPPMTVLAKKAADIALTIDAMDLLHFNRFDAICVASSDSDFSPLAIRVRAHGLTMIGFGHREPAPALRHACDIFTIPAGATPRCAPLPAPPSEIPELGRVGPDRIRDFHCDHAVVPCLGGRYGGQGWVNRILLSCATAP